MRYWYTILAALLGVFTSCSNDIVERENEEENKPVEFNLSRAELEIYEAQNDFTWTFLNEAFAVSEGNDILLSPLGVQMALNMTANGMGEQSLIQVLDALGVNDLNALNSLDASLLDKLPKCDQRGAKVEMCFANWQDKNTKFVPDFATKLTKLFGVPTYSCDFNSQDIMSIVNNWAKESTNGLIDRVIDKKPNSSVKMFLCNSIYFKGIWTLPFDKNKTTECDFNDINGNPIGKAMMMEYPVSDDPDFKYTQFSGFKVASFGFGKNYFSLNIFLSDDNCTLKELCERIKNNYTAEQQKFSFRNYRSNKVLIPRFEASPKIEDFNKLLLNLGVDLTKGDYKGICSDNLSIEMSQTNYVSIDEEGAKAASVTKQEGLVTAPTPSPIGEDFIADRPFIYTITGPYCTLFVGTMSNPGIK